MTPHKRKCTSRKESTTSWGLNATATGNNFDSIVAVASLVCFSNMLASSEPLGSLSTALSRYCACWLKCRSHVTTFCTAWYFSYAWLMASNNFPMMGSPLIVPDSKPAADAVTLTAVTAISEAPPATTDGSAAAASTASSEMLE
ncbi:unnamed protein product [Prorocentrum cordatum]|uniref:Uncharacterized protein n=1 Tax=Prorocentrum cordatum TaxID=2364126 RepID=A0ABN9R0J0_9DINO|nr:unnamed protein product [Polarella glacialis]